MPVYDLIARRHNGEIHVKVGEDDWRSVNLLPVRVVSVYVVQSFNKTMKAVTGALHAVVSYGEENWDVVPRQAHPDEEFVAGRIHGLLLENSDDDVSYHRSDGSARVFVKSKSKGKLFEVSVREVKGS